MSFGTYEPLSIMKSDWPIDGTLTKMGIPALPLPISSIKRINYSYLLIYVTYMCTFKRCALLPYR